MRAAERTLLGSHGKAFATNFNPEINIREITARGRYWEGGEWKETDPLSVSSLLRPPSKEWLNLLPQCDPSQPTAVPYFFTLRKPE